MLKMKKRLAAALVFCLLAMLVGCGSNGTSVYVQRVSELSGNSVDPGDRFAGMVVSEKVTEINRDMDKNVAELLVKAGDDVSQGQALFSYDTDQLTLNLDKQKLEQEQIEASIENYKEQIAELEKERSNASSGDQLQYTVQIQSLQVELKEAELNLEAKKKEVAQSQAILDNAVVTAPVSGRVKSVNESGTDSYGNPTAFIVIQQAGSFRVQGTLGELQRGGIMEGTRMKIVSRTDENQVWMGTVTLVDYESPSQNSSGSDMYGYGFQEGSDGMTSSSKYPFYVELDSADGLILGQHVYLSVDFGNGETGGVQLNSAFICFVDSGEAYVWAEKNGKLEKRMVTLGDYNPDMDTYAVTDGLSESDYIAFPDEELCRPGVPTTRQEPQTEDGGVDSGDYGMPEAVPAKGGV